MYSPQLYTLSTSAEEALPQPESSPAHRAAQQQGKHTFSRLHRSFPAGGFAALLVAGLAHIDDDEQRECNQEQNSRDGVDLGCHAVAGHRVDHDRQRLTGRAGGKVGHHEIVD